MSDKIWDWVEWVCRWWVVITMSLLLPMTFLLFIYSMIDHPGWWTVLFLVESVWLGCYIFNTLIPDIRKGYLRRPNKADTI